MSPREPRGTRVSRKLGKNEAMTRKTRPGTSEKTSQSKEPPAGRLDELIQQATVDAYDDFADEAGAWQVGVHWEKVLPPWFNVLSATAEPEVYSHRTVGLLKHHWERQDARPGAKGRDLGLTASTLPKTQTAVTTSRPGRWAMPFSNPGARTPTCMSRHPLRFADAAAEKDSVSSAETGRDGLS